jgi:diguanylate cyclase (GGDEF)-like protein
VRCGWWWRLPTSRDRPRSLRSTARSWGTGSCSLRRVLDTRVQEEYLRHIREGRPLGLIILDVDFFKGHNDALGRQAGDEVLRVIAAVLDDHARRGGDIAARYGGEEFALVLPNADVHGAYRVAEEIRRSVEEMGLNHAIAPSTTPSRAGETRCAAARCDLPRSTWLGPECLMQNRFP